MSISRCGLHLHDPVAEIIGSISLFAGLNILCVGHALRRLDRGEGEGRERREKGGREGRLGETGSLLVSE